MRNYWCPDCEKQKTKKGFNFGYALPETASENSTGHSYCRVCDRSFAHEGAQCYNSRYSQPLRFIYSDHGDEGAGEEFEREGRRGYHVNGGVMFFVR